MRQWNMLWLNSQNQQQMAVKEGSGISSDSSESLLLSCNAVKTNIQHSTELGD